MSFLLIRRMFSLPSSTEIPALTKLFIAKSDAITDRFLKSEPNVNSLRQWFLSNNELHALQSKVTFGQHVSTDEGVRLESRNAQETLQKYNLNVYQNKSLFQHVNKILEPVFAKDEKVPENEFKLFTDLHRDFVNNGLLLSDELRAKVKDLKQELQTLSLEFSKSVADDKTTIEFTAEELQGMSESYLNRLEKNDGKYILSMKYPDVIPVFDQCSNENTRKRLDLVYNSRCLDNIPRLETAVAKRLELAKLLGYPTFSNLQLQDRMAKNPETVWSFLNDLKSQLLPYGKIDLKKLESLKQGKLQPWDFRYYHNMLKINEYQVNETEIQQYFPVQHVLKQLLQFYADLFDLSIVQTNGETWHPDVLVYKVNDASTDELYGHFYVDLYPRDNKYSHAACFQLQPACLVGDKYQPSLAALVANFTKPTKTEPSLLKHDEVVTLAHELGHVFHVLCSVTKYSDQQGTNTAWDFVECPSQMLENFIYQPNVLTKLSKHLATNEPLPDSLITQIVKARNVNASLFNLRQIFFATYDMTLHSSSSVVKDTGALYSKLREEITLLPNHPGTNGQSTFNHIMGGYQSVIQY
eukprot:NODE_13_length_42895_cov_0.518413.p7 type:complete len:582 gc:universal NODE_13_length_42895_cov_0.518413:25232-23487(-)